MKLVHPLPRPSRLWGCFGRAKLALASPKEPFVPSLTVKTRKGNKFSEWYPLNLPGFGSSGAEVGLSETINRIQAVYDRMGNAQAFAFPAFLKRTIYF